MSHPLVSLVPGATRVEIRRVTIKPQAAGADFILALPAAQAMMLYGGMMEIDGAATLTSWRYFIGLGVLGGDTWRSANVTRVAAGSDAVISAGIGLTGGVVDSFVSFPLPDLIILNATQIVGTQDGGTGLCNLDSGWFSYLAWLR